MKRVRGERGEGEGGEGRGGESPDSYNVNNASNTRGLNRN